MRVKLGKFACFCVESHFGSNLDLGIEAAVRYYSRQQRSAGGALPPLRTLQPSEAPFVEVDVPFDHEALDGLEREAYLRSMDLQQLVNHAVFSYCADLDRDV